MKTDNTQYPLKTYSVVEERLNVLSHALGIVLSFVAGVVLLLKQYNLSLLVYSVGLLTMYVASTSFHSSKEPKLRYRLNTFDHCSIFLLIAATYTPFSTMAITGQLGMIILLIIWVVSVAGMIMKLFFTGRFRILSTILYVALGWVAVFAIKPLYTNLHFNGFAWLIAGGLFYTLGAVLYAIKSIKYNHAIFHFLVLLASACHYISIYFYVV